MDVNAAGRSRLQQQQTSQHRGFLSIISGEGLHHIAAHLVLLGVATDWWRPGSVFFGALRGGGVLDLLLRGGRALLGRLFGRCVWLLVACGADS
jgi:hypothetical protein